MKIPLNSFHLHSVFLSSDDNEGKPCFVHRDLSSKNVLVSPNITCVLSDFGFAMKMPEIGSTKSTDDIITEVDWINNNVLT